MGRKAKKVTCQLFLFSIPIYRAIYEINAQSIAGPQIANFFFIVCIIAAIYYEKRYSQQPKLDVSEILDYNKWKIY